MFEKYEKPSALTVYPTGVEEIAYKNKERDDIDTDYVLRVSTPGCNLRCIYCRRDKTSNKNVLSDEELLEVIKAASECGIKRVRWTGGEPVIRKRKFVRIVEETKNLGIL